MTYIGPYVVQALQTPSCVILMVANHAVSRHVAARQETYSFAGMQKAENCSKGHHGLGV